jgi:hypothetical protein
MPATFQDRRGLSIVNRKKWLVAGVLFLGVAKIAWSYYANWGLITIHANKQPLSKIVSEIQRQGHVTLKTNLDATTPVTMDVDRVPVSDALETVAVVTESRWRLNYFFAQDRGALLNGIDAIAAGNKPEDWKVIYYPVPQIFLPSNGVVPDPRHDLWTTKAPDEMTLQGWMDGVAKMANVGFAVPEKWNPPIATSPGSGEIGRVVPRLAKAAHGKMEAIFLLTKSERRQWGGGGDRQPQDGGGGPRNFEWMADRIQAEINRLPETDRADAQAQYDAERKFRESLKDLPDDQRRAKMQERMNDPAVQDQMDKRQAARDVRSTPQQKLQRAQNYVDRKQALKGNNQ